MRRVPTWREFCPPDERCKLHTTSPTLPRSIVLLFLFFAAQIFRADRTRFRRRAVSDRDDYRDRNSRIAMTRVADREDASFGREGFARLCLCASRKLLRTLCAGSCARWLPCNQRLYSRSGKRTKLNARLDSIFVLRFFNSQTYNSRTNYLYYNNVVCENRVEYI